MGEETSSSAVSVLSGGWLASLGVPAAPAGPGELSERPAWFCSRRADTSPAETPAVCLRLLMGGVSTGQ